MQLSGVTRNKIYHGTSIALVALVPLGIALSPSALTTPVDFALAAVIPLHTQLGMKMVIGDYVNPPAMRRPATFLMWGVTALTFGGLMKTNVQGAGVSASLKHVVFKNKDQPTWTTNAMKESELQ
eukprot:TRINITY_DN501_c0_g1_i1.p1 TRINITY_DN501_c0_g1~~TRINITY_DN501_c0_g1_i1.p1  ORF type:complete len:133 (-),score=14.78 TRINITY_DN501_c0_g1_i1:147-521(-)